MKKNKFKAKTATVPKKQHHCPTFLAEASCRSQIRTAKAVASELGPAARSSGVQAWADIPMSVSERGVDKVVKKQGTRLDIEIDEVNSAGTVFPWINPKTWLTYLLRMGLWHRLAGLHFDDRSKSGDVWEQFWNQYEQLVPDFEAFSHPFDRKRTAAVFLHGDEGRTLKKGGLMVVTFQSCLGFGFDQKRLKRRLDGSYKHLVNYVGHTFATRFVSIIVPKTAYEKNHSVLHGLMDHFGQHLGDLFTQGVQGSDGHVYRLCVIGTKGDWPFLVKVGKLTRHFSTTVKRGNQRAPPKGVCHLCLAGTNEFPYEELGELNPSWEATMGVREPWEATPLFLRHLPVDLAHPATHFQGDPWHTIHLGIGRGFITSTVCLALQLVPMRLMEEKWDWLTNHYFNFCKVEKHQPHVTKISPTLMGYSDAGGPNGMWHKGALTTTLMKWLEKLLPDLQMQPNSPLEKAHRAAVQLNRMFSFLFNAGFFLDREEGLYASHLGKEWITSYKELAEITFARGWAMYPLLPKAHAFEHIILRMRREAMAHHLTINPLVVGCQADEDLVGRISRLSRRVSIRTVSVRTFQRYLTQCYTSWVAAGILIDNGN